ncbi:hypothetical protein SK128_015022 [Halocaridina rubra]|uniref:Transporter n=1 Tax=Halocaridina rubra TaxID=373956 RepID=A0AAN8WC54_HALRR
MSEDAVGRKETEDIVEEIQEIPKDEQSRETWSNKYEFLLSCLGYAIGYGNVWRFPYLCYKNGGAAFLIPYFIMLFCAGLPLFFMELAIGQYISLGPNILFQKLAPVLSGLGWGMVMIALLTAIYFNVIIAWSLFYTIASLTSVLPWGHCDNDFNTVDCYSETAASFCRNQSLFYRNGSCLTVQEYCGEALFHAHNITHCHHPTHGAVSADSVLPKVTPSEDYFKNRMLGISDDISWENMGTLRWELVMYLVLSWVLVAASLYRGIKSLGKVVYFTATFPYVILVILFARGITLEGAYQGIEFYLLKPDLSRLLEVEVWSDAAVQIFYSMGVCFGSLITLSSYNKFNNNCMRDAFIIGISNSATSIFTGFVIFSILGFLAHELGVEVKDVASSGSGLVFVVYPAALALLPIPQLWSVLFFFMIINIGLSSQFSMVETVTTAFFDQFEFLRPKKPFFVALICFGMFLLGLTMCLQGGILMFELFFWYSAGLSVIILAITHLFGIHYLYGFRKFLGNIKEMGINIPFPIKCYWTITWLVTTPLSLLVIVFFSIYFFVPAYWGNYTFPNHIQILGWCLCLSSFGCIPIGMLFACYRAKKCKDLTEPSQDFCPAAVRKERQDRQTAMNTSFHTGTFRYVYDNVGFQSTDLEIPK